MFETAGTYKKWLRSNSAHITYAWHAVLLTDLPPYAHIEQLYLTSYAQSAEDTAQQKSMATAGVLSDYFYGPKDSETRCVISRSYHCLLSIFILTILNGFRKILGIQFSNYK